MGSFSPSSDNGSPTPTDDPCHDPHTDPHINPRVLSPPGSEVMGSLSQLPPLHRVSCTGCTLWVFVYHVIYNKRVSRIVRKPYIVKVPPCNKWAAIRMIYLETLAYTYFDVSPLQVIGDQICQPWCEQIQVTFAKKRFLKP